MKASSSRLIIARGSMDRGGTLQELRRSPTIPHIREDITTTMEAITMEDIRIMEQVCITTVAPRMEMGMEEAAARTVPNHQHQPRGI